MKDSKIEWTDSTWNPVRGCTKISPGCEHCYAERFAERFRGVPGHPFEHGFDLRLVPDKLTEPFHWREPRRIFVNSMSDLFHKKVPDAFLDQVFAVMALSDAHTFQVLTKRPRRMRDYASALVAGKRQMGSALESIGKEWLLGRLSLAGAFGVTVGSGGAEPPYQPFSNVWLGVSVENRKHGLPRVDLLRETPAAVRFLSIEPLLEDLGEIDLTGIHWVIVGGESGPGARPMLADWVHDIRLQCAAARVPFFFKQWGGVDKKAAGRMLNGRTYDALPAGCGERLQKA